MRAHNFGAGPCTLPLEVLEEVQAEFLDFGGTGMSLIEMSHRSPEYESVHELPLALPGTWRRLQTTSRFSSSREEPRCSSRWSR